MTVVMVIYFKINYEKLEFFSHTGIMRKSSFSIVRDEESDNSNKSFDDDLVPLDKKSAKQFKYLDKISVKTEDDSDGESKQVTRKDSSRLSAGKDFSIPSDGLLRKSTLTKVMTKNSSGSDEDEESAMEEIHRSIRIPNEYNPSLYQDLDVDDEVRELFQYIVKYMPQQLTLDYKFKPFIPDYLPAVGDIDAFLKVVPPEPILFGENFNIQEHQLGIAVLDEPATTQSDSALLHLQLRASNLGVPQDASDVIVKKVDKVDKNHKVIDKWIKDISDLHRSKSSPFVRYAEPMPDIDDLMQEWPEEIENQLKEHGFPAPEPHMTLTEYLELICDVFQIPTTKNKVHSLHVLFSLYAAVKDSKFYKPSKGYDKKSDVVEINQPDQLVLD
ncbi:intraflagellar transport protein 46 homolog isoform X2 [Coccinella septempunctata]|uniref:intraflagellar transport protein 46 homolog isoform X2 n=1 Tax=Coccinella septempunctata TaxID=41139 RepID=UPI001D07E3BE|nr:intraflagellar transport protein 46 homolog isoform X2 [Coccinella septempunctata]